MPSWRSSVAGAALACAAFAGCYGGGPAEPPTPPTVSDSDAGPTSTAPPTSLEQRSCPPSSPYDWENFGEPFVLTWCTGCHSTDLGTSSRQGAPMAINFNTLDDVRQHADRIWARAADSNATMPPSGGPLPADRTALGDWLACGMPSTQTQ
jgi:hypothetical protein